MRMSVISVAAAAALLWAFAFFFVGAINIIRPPYGLAFLEVMSSIYPGYQNIGTPGSILIGTIYAFVDGGVAGALFAGFNNFFAVK